MENVKPCRYCGKIIEIPDAFCRHCGYSQGSKVPFRYTHAGIILFTLLFGPVALPFIWKSPVLDKKIRIVYCSLNIIITVLMVSTIFSAYSTANKQFQETIRIINATGIGAVR